jgi:hypothetical protein
MTAVQGKHILDMLPFFEMTNNRWLRVTFEHLYYCVQHHQHHKAISSDVVSSGVSILFCVSNILSGKMGKWFCIHVCFSSSFLVSSRHCRGIMILDAMFCSENDVSITLCEVLIFCVFTGICEVCHTSYCPLCPRLIFDVAECGFRPSLENLVLWSYADRRNVD